MPSRVFTLASRCVLKTCYSVRSASRFSVPTWFRSGAARSRSQDWPKATAAGVRAAVLTAVSTAPGSFRSGARLIVPPVAVVLLAHHHRPGDACHLVGERTGDDLRSLVSSNFASQGSSLARLLHNTDIAPLTNNRRR